MKRLVLLSVLYIYLETGLCSVELADLSHIDAELTEKQQIPLVKRNTAFKRLPAWSVYYGKRSGDQDYDIHKDKFDNALMDSFEKLGGDIVNDSESEEEGISKQWMLDYLDNNAQHNNLKSLDAVKRSNLKRLQPWMSTYGKRSQEILNSGTGFDSDNLRSSSETGLTDNNLLGHLSDEVFERDTDFDMDELQSNDIFDTKRYPGWSTSYGKRGPWGVTYGKRAPWGVTYGKRAPWGVTYGKRAPWAVTYGKREPWGVTYGKRAPWSVTYGKRAPWSVTYGKRAPWSVTYGKRAPWSITYGKRAPWSATYGKRSQGWNAFYGKRAPMWQAVYGKRNADDATVKSSVSDDIDHSEDTQNIADKRNSQAWSAFYGR